MSEAVRAGAAKSQIVLPKRLATLCLATLMTVAYSSESFAEVWVDSTGKFKIDAELLGVKDGKIALRKTDGSQVIVPIERLSAESQALLKQVMSKNAATPAPAAQINPVAPASGGQPVLGKDITAEEMVAIANTAAESMDVDTLWDLMPPSYQTDIQDVVRLAATNVDSAFWTSITSLIDKAAKLTEERREMFFNSQPLSPFLKNDAATVEVWEASSAFLKVIGASTVTDQAAMRQFDMKAMIQNDSGKFAESATRLGKAIEAMSKTNPNVQVGATSSLRLISAEGDRAVVEVTSGEMKNEMTYVKVEGRWVLEQMAQDWEKNIAKAKQSLQQLATPEGKQQLMGAQFMLMTVSTPMDQLLAANSQAEFDQVIAGITAMAGGMMGGMQPQ